MSYSLEHRRGRVYNILCLGDAQILTGHTTVWRTVERFDDTGSATFLHVQNSLSFLFKDCVLAHCPSYSRTAYRPLPFLFKDYISATILLIQGLQIGQSILFKDCLCTCKDVYYSYSYQSGFYRMEKVFS